MIHRALSSRILILALALISLWGFLSHIKGLPLSGNNDNAIKVTELDINAFILGLIFLSSLIALGLSLMGKESKTETPSTPNGSEPIRGTKNELPELLSADALMLLSLFQKEGRLLDFLKEDILGYDDSKVASACRVVHRGCSEVLKNHLQIEPIINAAEDSVIDTPNVPRSHIRIAGAETAKIKIIHAGWQLKGANLPKKIQDIADSSPALYPAEAESVPS